eukprot:a1169_346.p2 GENE.a1169_346~~a1169_346.p2  ORF type:complete len:360 (+),score=171.10 a1169_346:44-1081(+)
MADVATENMIFCLCNPLLDISATVPETLLAKYDLKANDAILADASKHMPLYDEVAAMEGAEFIAGGATQNSARVAQWFFDQPRVCTYVGCVGTDDNGRRLRSIAEADRVRIEYLEDSTTPTGTCACLITNAGKARSLVANLAAANHYKADHLHRPEIWSLVEGAQLYYSSGFPLTVCPDAMLDIARHAAAQNKVYCFNLSAPFLVQFFKDPMMALMPFVDVLFGNETEAGEFAKVHGFANPDDLGAVALALAAQEKTNKSRERIVVITHGAEETVVAHKGVVTKYPVTRVDPALIVDTNGAGDAFVGGFISAYVMGQDMTACVARAHAAAAMIIQRSGTSLPARV